MIATESTEKNIRFRAPQHLPTVQVAITIAHVRICALHYRKLDWTVFWVIVLEYLYSLLYSCLWKPGEGI